MYPHVADLPEEFADRVARLRQAVLPDVDGRQLRTSPRHARLTRPACLLLPPRLPEELFAALVAAL
jgi:hypothetical protein